jgi:hypothetical protein
MSFVGAGMHRYSLRAKTFAVNGSLYDVGIISPTRVPECGNFINIDAKSCHGHIFNALITITVQILFEKTTKQKP